MEEERKIGREFVAIHFNQAPARSIDRRFNNTSYILETIRTVVSSNFSAYSKPYCPMCFEHKSPGHMGS